MFRETIIQAIQDVRKQSEVCDLRGISKTVVEYLLSEVEEAIEKDRLMVRKNIRRQKSIPLLSIKFSYNGLYVSTFYKYGAAHIKCIKFESKQDAKAVVSAIEAVCKSLNWSVEFDRTQTHQLEHDMEIRYNLPEETAP